MPNAVDVTPLRWSNIIVLFDDGDYSVIWGNYDNSKKRVIGVRWNGNDVLEGQSDKGFPTSRGKPVWHVEAEFLTLPIVSKLIERNVWLYDNDKLSEGHFREYKHNLMVVLQERMHRD